MADAWETQFGLKLVSANRDFTRGEWRIMNDHAALIETSLMLAVRPDLVDMAQLPQDRSIWPTGVGGEDPRDASVEHGEEQIASTLQALGKNSQRWDTDIFCQRLKQQGTTGRMKNHMIFYVTIHPYSLHS